MKFKIFIPLLLFLSVYNIWYGALCWRFAGYTGLIIGSLFMVGAVILGVIVKKYYNAISTKEEIQGGKS